MHVSRHWRRTHERKSEIVPVVRKLAAILAADVVGYGLLMGADEEGTLTRLKAHRRSLVDRKLSVRLESSGIGRVTYDSRDVA